MISCSSGENVLESVFNNVKTGAILRTVSIDNLIFDTDAPDRPISLKLEYQDGKNASLLETVVLTLSFDDRTPENGDNSKPPSVYKILTRSDFEFTTELPRTAILISPQELLDFFGFNSSDIKCTDRFVLDLKLNLNDGRSFEHDTSIGPIISLGGPLNSPFTYDIFVAEGVNEQLFTGKYTFQSIQDGFQGPTFSTPEIIDVTTNRPNTRRFEVFIDEQLSGGFFYRADIEFVIACDQAILTRYVRSAIICAGGVEGDIHMLLGPQENLDQTINIDDDAVFSLKFLEAFEGNDGFCDWPLTPSEIRYSKQ